MNSEKIISKYKRLTFTEGKLPVSGWLSSRNISLLNSFSVAICLNWLTQPHTHPSSLNFSRGQMNLERNGCALGEWHFIFLNQSNYKIKLALWELSTEAQVDTNVSSVRWFESEISFSFQEGNYLAEMCNTHSVHQSAKCGLKIKQKDNYQELWPIMRIYWICFQSKQGNLKNANCGL